MRINLEHVFSVAILATLGCDRSEDSRTEIFAEIQLEMSGDRANVNTELRVALAWANHSASNQLQITDDYSWPANADTLAFGLSRHPSSDTLYDWGSGQGALSVGGLVVYEDTDKDGQLTFTMLGEAFEDRIVGWSPGLRVVSAPADIVETSQFDPGHSLFRTTYSEGRQQHDLEAIGVDNTSVAIETFGEPEAWCFGLSPGPEYVPTAVDTRPIDREAPQFGAFFQLYDGKPFVPGIPECPFDFDSRPNEWASYQATCIAGEESLVAIRYVESTDASVASMCGRQVSRCHFVLDKIRYPPRGVPSEVCSGG